jgi:hypothetical protein
MPIQSSNFGSLSEAAQLKKLKSAKVALWIVGILTIALYGFLFANAEKEFDKAYGEELRKLGVSESQVRSLDEETRAEIDKEKADGLAKMKLIYGAGAGLGGIFIVCALLVYKKPLISTMTGLVLYLGGIAANAALEPQTIAKGIIVKIIIIAVLAGAVKAAIAYEREKRQRNA